MLITLDQHPSAQIEVGELLTVVQVSAANVVKDIRENIRNLVGGRRPDSAAYSVVVLPEPVGPVTRRMPCGWRIR